LISSEGVRSPTSTEAWGEVCHEVGAPRTELVGKFVWGITPHGKRNSPDDLQRRAAVGLGETENPTQELWK
jgi:hypothetical protein